MNENQQWLLDENTEHQRLSLVKAEQKKVESLKSYGVPWVFVSPTRLKCARNQYKKQKPNVQVFEDIDADDLAFLGESDIPFTREDIEILQRSLNGEKISAKEHSVAFEDAINEIRKRHAMKMVEEQHPEEEEIKPAIPDEDESFLTPRDGSDDEGEFFDGLIEKEEKKVNEEVRMTPEAEADTVKMIIMGNLNEKRGIDTATSKKSENEDVNIEMKPQVQKKKQFCMFQYTFDQTPGGAPIVKEKPGEGRQRIKDAVAKASRSYEDDCVTLARKKLSKESALKQAALEKCFGAAHFRDFLEKSNQKIPKALSTIDFKTQNIK